MPYIKKEDRTLLDPLVNYLQAVIGNQGELAYVIYRLVRPSVNYETLSTGRAVLQDCYDLLSCELLDYEAKKKAENGDV